MIESADAQPLNILENSAAINVRGIKSTQSRCCVCHSSTGRKIIPWAAIQQAWFQRLCYIPKSNRTCVEHLTTANKFYEDVLQTIDDAKLEIQVPCDEFESWLLGITDLPSSTLYNFEEDGVEAEKYEMFFGLSKENFDDLIQYLHGKCR